MVSPTTCLLTAGTVAVCVYFGAILIEKPSQDGTAICFTPACVLAASEILQNLSPRREELDPCADFDKYVCEGWNEKHDLRADQGSAFTGTIMEENSQLLLRHILESPYSGNYHIWQSGSSTDREIFKKLQATYDACMDEGTLKELGSAPLLDVLRKVEEIFPALKPHQAFDPFPKMKNEPQKGLMYNGESQLSNAVAYLTRIGVNSLISFDISADDKNPDSVVIYLNAPHRPGLPNKEYYKDEKILGKYAETIGLVLEALLKEAGPDSTVLATWRSQLSSTNGYSEMSDNLVKALVDFESRLAKATPAEEDAEDVTKYYNPRSLEETKALLPQLSVQYIISSFAPAHTPDQIIVGSPSYLEAASRVLHEATPETVQAYLVWKVVQAYAEQIEDDAVKPLLRFNNQLQGKEPDALEERWRKCVKEADRGLGWILSKFFVEKAFSEEAKEFGDRIVIDIKEQFIKKLKAAEWMSTEVRQLGIEKVHNIVQKIGYPTKSPDVRNSSALLEYYEAVNISTSTFFDNSISIATSETNREWSALGKPTNRDEWGMSVPTVNAYYNPAGNEIVFPAGIMQAPVFYDPTVPQYLSYGAFGSVSGHELSHAFDSTGRHFDQTGNFADWWDNQTVQAFTDKAQCFIDQYHDFTVPGPDDKALHVNGRLTLGENIADAGGLSASFVAWKQHERLQAGQLLPGLQGFTKEQLFFISYSNWWCGKTRKEAAIDHIYRDPHAPNWARILGTMANSREFKESFGCPKREPTCELW